MMRGRVEDDGRRGSEEDEGEYDVGDLRDRIKSSRGSRFDLLANELGLEDSNRRKFSRETVINGIRDLSRGLVIHPDNRSRSLSLSLSLFAFSLLSVLFVRWTTANSHK